MVAILRCKNKIDFCFKPHPGLKTKLYQHKDWGYKKTNDYFNYWSQGDNTILSQADYKIVFSKEKINSLLKDAEKRLLSNQISDKQKYLLNYKIDTLKQIN